MTVRSRQMANCLTEVAEEMRHSFNRMVAIQMQAYPDSWPESDKREMAEGYFGRRELENEK